MNARFELYQLVAPLAGLGIWERDLVAGTFFWNTIIYQLLEVPTDYQAPLDQTLNFYKDQEQLRSLFHKATKTGEPQVTEAAVVTAKGNEKWFKVRAAAVMEDQRCVQLYGTVEDITKEVTLRHLMQEREQRFAQAFGNAPIGMALVSLEGGWIRVNPSLCDMLGYSEAEFLSKTFQQFTYPDDLESDLKQVQLLLNNKIRSYSMEKRYFHRDGHLIWAQLNVSLVRDEQGTPLYFVSQIKDISGQKKQADIILNQNSRLLNFAHIVSHNLRSHAGNIHMLAQMVMDETDEYERREMLGMLDDNAQTLLETLSHLNEVVRVQQNNAVSLKSLNLLQEIGRVTDILAPSIKDADGTVTVDVDPALTVKYDPAYLESVLINLVSNAIKYRDATRPLAINISAALCDKKLVLRVQDNGLGIDLEKHRNKLFGMYETFHNHPDSRGVGLYLVKSQVEAMGGHIDVASSVGEGTVFSIEIGNGEVKAGV